MSYTNNSTYQIAYKYTGIKTCYNTDKFAFKGNKSKVVCGTVLTLKIGPHFKKSLRNIALDSANNC